MNTIRRSPASRGAVAAMGLLLVLVLVLGFAAGAAAQSIVPFGQPVGANGFGFEAPCNRGEVLTGIFVSGNFVALSPRCAIASNPRPKTQARPERWYQQPNSGWDPASAGWADPTCPDIAPMLLSIRVQTLTDVNSQIQYLRFFKVETFCGVDGNHPSREQAGGLYSAENSPGWQPAGGTQFCPAGQVAVGIRGRFQRSGEGLEALGLSCGDPKIGSRGLQTPASAGNAGVAGRAEASRVGGRPSTASTLGTAPAVAVKNNANTATLNQQPPPPTTPPGPATINPQSLGSKTLSGATSLDSQARPAKTAASAASLNVQPLPQGSLPQAPSSLR